LFRGRLGPTPSASDLVEIVVRAADTNQMWIANRLGDSSRRALRVERTTRRALDAASRVSVPAAWSGVAFGLGVSWLIAYLVGGAGVAAPHWFYLPVLYAAARFGCRGAGASALAAGLLAGPLMPLDVAAGVAQQPADWITPRSARADPPTRSVGPSSSLPTTSK
jgi:hypothetical protein